jgi:hypothetical protein
MLNPGEHYLRWLHRVGHDSHCGENSRQRFRMTSSCILSRRCSRMVWSHETLAPGSVLFSTIIRGRDTARFWVFGRKACRKWDRKEHRVIFYLSRPLDTVSMQALGQLIFQANPIHQKLRWVWTLLASVGSPTIDFLVLLGHVLQQRRSSLHISLACIAKDSTDVRVLIE